MNARQGMSMTAVVALLVLGACSSSGHTSRAIDSLDALPHDAPTESAPTSTSTTVPSGRLQTCKSGHLETATYPPDPSDDGFVAHLREVGRVRVGVDENTRGLSFRNPLTGDFEGFEVELAKELAQRIFPDADPSTTLELVPLVTDEKTNAVADELVDMTISAVSMSCDRWEQVDFSAEYYTAHQKFLVHSDSDIRTREDLEGRTVCVTNKSSSKTILARAVPAAVPLTRRARTDCLVALQLGEADAYFGHDTFLYGMLEQDHTVEIQDLLPPNDTVSHYGIAVNRQHPDFTRFLNWALEDISSQRWDEIVNATVVPAGIPVSERPTPDYRRTG